MKRRSGSTDHFYAVILAGGRGTRFWPRSRKRLPKQLLPVLAERSMIQQTVDRLRALVPPERIWVFTNEILRLQVIRQLPEVPRHQIIAEPLQRNTGPAIALAARLIGAQDPRAVIGVFPSDHLIAKDATFLRVLRRGVRAAARENLVVLGIPPRWPETGYGYIEYPRGSRPGAANPLPVIRFREKPDARTAKRFVKAGNFYWNSGMFVWQAQVIGEAVARFMPQTAKAISKIGPSSARSFRRSLAEHYPLCEDLSIDYGVLERAGNIVGFACPDFGWNDVGSWDALYNLLPKDGQDNVARSPVIFEEANGAYVDAPGKLVALINVQDLVVVDTPDALLICSRKDTQKVSALVKALEKEGLDALL